MKRQISIVLALLLVFIAVVSCGNDKPATEKTDTSAVSEKVIESDSATETQKKIDDLETEKFDGADFTITYRDINGSKGWGEWTVFTEDDDGTVMNSAVWMRNQDVSENFGINMKFDAVNDSGVYKCDFFNRLEETFSSGDSIGDLCIPGVMDATAYVYSGIFTDLNTFDEIDFSHSWWRTNINSSLSIAGKQYVAIHDMLINDVRDTFAIYFNKDVMDDRQMLYPYGLVYDGQWTLDTFGEMVKGFGGDLDGDSEVTIDDRFGLITAYNDVFFVGSGIVGAKLNPDTGLPELTDFSDKIAGIYDWLFELQNTNTYDVWNYMAYGDGHMQELFDKKSLFLNRSVNMLQFFASTYDSKIGVLPVPKYDEEQRHYISRAGYSGTTVLTIPANVADKHMSAVIVEALGQSSQKYIRPAFYEKMLGARYLDDLENDRKMIDLIIAGEVMDIDQMYQFGNVLVKFAHNAYTGGTASSAYETYRSAAQGKLDAFLASLNQ